MTTIKHNIFIHSSQIISISTTSLEIVAVECTLPNHSKWLFICCYRPPDANNLNDCRSLCDNLLPNYEQIIIGGDLNFPNITWMESNYAGFCDILDDYFMSQLCLLPTRDFNILDLLITNLPELVSISDVRNPSILGMSSDHRIIQFKISVSLNPIVQTKRLVFDYKRADFDGLRHRLMEANISSLLSRNGGESSIDADWLIWKEIVRMSAIRDHIPSKHVNTRRTPPWITPNILHQIRKKDTVRKRFLNRGTAYLKINFAT